jgi:hypothetical protein
MKIASDEDGFDVSGSRELERVIWGLKNTIRHLTLGNYLWDDIVVYIGEICKHLEVLQINSQHVTDGSLSHVLKKCAKLSALDFSGCTNFCGLAFQQIEDEEYSAKNLKWL